VNIENMLKLKEFILAEAESKHLAFDMDYWIRFGTIEGSENWPSITQGCGYAACLAGSAVACLHSPQEARDLIPSHGVAKEAERLLGLEGMPRWEGVPEIFDPRLKGWPFEIAEEYREADRNGDVMGRAKAAARLIDHLVCQEVEKRKAELESGSVEG